MSDVEIHHIDGVPWHEAKVPFWLHRCRAQTYGWMSFQYIERCACGALRYDRRVWIRKNDRLKGN